MLHMTDRDDLGSHVRNEAAPDAASVVNRGGPDTVAKLRTHAERTHRAFVLDTSPLGTVRIRRAR